MTEYFGFMGNTNGNLANGGYVCEFGDSILISLSDGLYILDKESKKHEKIYHNTVKYLNVADDFIYFVDDKNSICEMSIMDSDVYRIVERNFPHYDEIYYVALIDEYLYYATFWGESVYRINVIEGVEEFLFHTVALNFAFDTESMYYCDDKDGLIRRIYIDEIDRIIDMLPKDKTQMWLEYQGFSLEHAFDILNKGLDKKIEINDIVMEEILGDEKSVYFVDFDDIWLYYGGAENDSDDGEINLYRIDLEEFEEEELTSDDIDYLNMSNGWIYYRNNSDEGVLYIMSTDGTIKRRLTEFPVSQIHVAEEWVYCRNEEDNDAFYRVNSMTSEVQNIRTYYGIED